MILQCRMNASKVENRSCTLGYRSTGAGMAHLSPRPCRYEDGTWDFLIVRVSMRRAVEVKTHRNDGLSRPVPGRSNLYHRRGVFHRDQGIGFRLCDVDISHSKKLLLSGWVELHVGFSVAVTILHCTAEATRQGRGFTKLALRPVSKPFCSVANWTPFRDAVFCT